MPYVVLKKGPGYKVCKKSDKSVCFSKKPLPKERAEDQRKAMYASESVLNEFNIADNEEQEELPAFWWKNIKMESAPNGRIAIEFYEEVGEEPTLVLYYNHEHGFSDDIKVEGVHYEEADQNPKFDLDQLQFAVSAAEEEMQKSEEDDEAPVRESLSFQSYFNVIMENEVHSKLVSNCCGASATNEDELASNDNHGRCSKCKEMAKFEPEEE